MFSPSHCPHTQTPSIIPPLTMGFTITKLSQELILPCEPTPSGTLALSWLDQHPLYSSLMVQSLHVFEHGREPARVIKEALSKALVFYYPFAGRLAQSEGGELQVSCTTDGVWFVEATADCGLEAVSHFEDPPAMAERELLPYPAPMMEHDEESKHCLMLQVTTFTCGGYVVGLRVNHKLADGMGAGQLVTAISEMARGLARPTMAPVWDRECIPGPSRKLVPCSLQAPAELGVLDLTVDIPLDFINRTKAQFTAETDQRCSTFDILVAKAWQARAQAMEFGLGTKTDVHVYFFMTLRQMWKHLLPSKGFYGNCYYMMKVSSPIEKLVGGSIVEALKVIREAKGRLATEFERFMKGEMEEDRYAEAPGYDSLLVSDWSWFGFHDVDYGWGKPVHAVPFITTGCIPLCMLIKPPVHKQKQGFRLFTKCVNKEHFAEFKERITNLE